MRSRRRRPVKHQPNNFAAWWKLNKREVLDAIGCVLIIFIAAAITHFSYQILTVTP